MPSEDRKMSGKVAEKVQAEIAACDPDRCRFYLAKKRRYCGWPVKKGQEYCGNHLWQATGEGETRVPCPANPNHDVPVSQLYAHLPKCPDAVYRAAMRAQPYFQENVNAGADDRYGLQHLQQPPAAAPPPGSAAAAAAEAAEALGLIQSGPEAAAAAAVAAEAVQSFMRGTAAVRQAAAVALGPEGFAALLAKIDAAHAVLTATYPLHTHQPYSAVDAPALKQQCADWDPLTPFDAKHALQNAAIVGNMQVTGLLRQSHRAVFMELGAGKAWLTAWLHMLTPSSNEFVLLDKVGSFANKADRRLRHTNVTRVAIDLKDAALLPLLHLHTSPHPAADSTAGSRSGHPKGSSTGKKEWISHSIVNEGGLLRLPRRVTTATTASTAAADGEVQTASGCCTQSASRQQQEQQQPVPWVVYGKHLCGGATDFALRGCFNAMEQQQQQQGVAGTDQGPGPLLEQHQQQQRVFGLQGVAIASCCHHRCGWMSYVGREALQAAAGIDKEDFEVIAWLTGWALCGHEAAPGAGQAPTGGDDEAAGDVGSAGGASNLHEGASGTTGTAAAASCHAHSGCGSRTGSTAGHQQPSDDHQQQQQRSSAEPWPWHPADTLTPHQRVQLGLKCKQLIDAGRCAWLQECLLPMIQAEAQGRSPSTVECGASNTSASTSSGSAATASAMFARRIAYIDEGITGENSLLVLGRM